MAAVIQERLGGQEGERSQRGSSDRGQGVKSVPGRVWEKAGEVHGQVKVSSSGLML